MIGSYRSEHTHSPTVCAIHMENQQRQLPVFLLVRSVCQMLPFEAETSSFCC